MAVHTLGAENFLGVSALNLSLNSGFTVITGPSGAGKSTLLQMLAFAAGAPVLRGDRALKASAIVRTGCKKASVTVTLDSPQTSVTRTVHASGRQSSALDGERATSESLQEALSGQIIFHTPHGIKACLTSSEYLRALDAVAGVKDVRDQVATWHKTCRRLRAELQTLQVGSQERAELVSYWIEELATLSMDDPPIADRLIRHSELATADDRNAALNEALHELTGDEGALSRLTSAQRKVQEIRASSAQQLALTAGEVITQINEWIVDMTAERDAAAPDPTALEAIETWMAQADKLARKHNTTIENLPTMLEALRDEERAREDSQARVLDLTSQLKDAEASYAESAAHLSRERRAVIPQAITSLTETLNNLELGRSVLSFEMTEAPASAAGTDKCTMLFAARDEFEPQPAQDVASGGEAARLAFALCVLQARSSGARTLVLDEADMGLSGDTSAKLGDAIARLADQWQIICVTHQPQIAARANHHILVSEGEPHILDHETTRVGEIARMLGAAGHRDSGESKAMAKALLGST